MPESLRAFIVITMIAGASYFLFKSAFRDLISASDYKKVFVSWISVSAIAFLSFNPFVYIFGISTYLFMTGKKENALFLYFALLFAVPQITITIPGFGLINYLIDLDHIRILNLFLLLPLITRQTNAVKVGKYKTDIFILLFILLRVVLKHGDVTLTDTLRGTFYIFVDIFIPYYVFSRALHHMQDIKRIVTALLIGLLLASSIGVFESIFKWLLYSSIEGAWGVNWAWGGYLGRDGGLRALASFGHSLVYGSSLVFGIGILLYLKYYQKKQGKFDLKWLVLIAGLIASMSRGPWVGGVLLYVTFLITGKKAMSNLFKFSFTAIAVLIMFLPTSVGSKIVNLIPFIGTTETGNIEYRQQLVDVSLKVIQKYPFFGSNFWKDPDMEVMRQGEGIIDVVNAYLEVSLSIGIVGLFFFVGIFLSSLLLIFNGIKKSKRLSEEYHIFGRCLFATLISSLFMIGSTGNALGLAALNWCFIGIAVTYWRIVDVQTKQL